MLKQRNYNEMVTYILDKIREMDISEDDKKTLFAYIISLESKYFMEMGNAERKGKWIEHENPKDVFSIECSECGCWFLHEHLVRNSYCPNCGASMVRGEEDE